MWFKTTVICLLVLYSISTVKCQNALVDEVTANLTKMVRYVIHPSAKASQEIIDYALTMGTRPKTLSDRIGYLEYIKNIARQLPEFMQQFTSATTLPDGSVVSQIDEGRFNGHITQKAMEYSQRDNQDNTTSSSSGIESALAQSSPVNPPPEDANGQIARVNVQAGSTNEITGNNARTSNTNSTSQNNANAVPKSDAFPVVPAADGTINLLDLFKIASLNRQNQVNP